MDHYLILDVEATCSDDGDVPRHEMEIIEIGAVMQNISTWETESEFQIFVKPVRHPHLTSFCTRLTGIRQSDVDDAPKFVESLAEMKKWMAGFGNTLFCSWGDYDRKQFVQDCKFHQVSYPFSSSHMNLKAEFARVCGLKKMGVTEALHHLGLVFEGSHHRGLDDAKNIARVARHIFMEGVV